MRIALNKMTLYFNLTDLTDIEKYWMTFGHRDTGFPNRGDMILNVPIGLIWTEIFDVCCQLSSVRFAI